MLNKKLLAVLTGVFLLLTSIAWAEPPAPVPKTGQIYCWNSSGGDISCTGTGQDGEYQKGVTISPRFSNHRDGTITDNLTGLMWMQNADMFEICTWAAAIEYCENLTLGDCGGCVGECTDWRLANLFELESLRDMSNHTPALPTDHPFTIGQESYYYWSSTTYAFTTSTAWTVNFGIGNLGTSPKSYSKKVWCVRNGPN